ncbi:hypothetical protein ACWCQK_27180 [Streptomyces sp. NPDC002306]
MRAALRVDLNGCRQAHLGADRDHALLSLALATGQHRHNLANTTTHELHRISSLPITATRVADQVVGSAPAGRAPRPSGSAMTALMPTRCPVLLDEQAWPAFRRTLQGGHGAVVVFRNVVR